MIATHYRSLSCAYFTAAKLNIFYNCTRLRMGTGAVKKLERTQTREATSASVHKAIVIVQFLTLHLNFPSRDDDLCVDSHSFVCLSIARG